ncbi:MAG: lipid-A-disaccharide synthase [Devosia sp.]|jgi:lipid-A-disaccharide synthase|nr:lipid-A-disaccharide synthase [Devosia sp.]
MPRALKLFVLAGEPSGDRIAADLVQRLRARVSVELLGVGGDELAAQGLRSLFPMSDLAVMGITDVLRRLPLLLWRVEQTARAIRAAAPDIAVLVDAQDFSALVARRLHRMGYRKPLVLYVAPSVWARAPQRAQKLRPLFSEVLAVLPFEPDVMIKLGGPPTTYVGHPALAEAAPVMMAPERGELLLLPGSREGELRRHLPLFKTVVAQLSQHPAVTGITIPTLPALQQRLADEVASWPVPVAIAAERAERPELYRGAVLALSVAGTATLELALAGVPMVVTYVMDSHQARVFGKLGQPMVALPNIIMGRPMLDELVMREPDADVLVKRARALLDSKEARQRQQLGFGELYKLMAEGLPGTSRQDPADRILAHLTANQRLSMDM